MANSIFNSLFPYALLLAALTYLIKSLIKHWLDKDVDNFKSRIEKEANLEIEKYKNQLDLERLRLQISYGGIFEKQATAILEIYRYLVELEKAAKDAIHMGDTSRKRREVFMQTWSEVIDSYHSNKILIPQNLDANLEHFMDRIFFGVLSYTSPDKVRIERMTDEQFEKFSKKQDQAIDIFLTELPSIKLELISTMRRTIGIELNTSNPLLQA